jgi:hypothetical protein
MSDKFTIEYLTVGLSNTDSYGKRSFADGIINVGPFRFRIYLHADGGICLPSSLHDDHLALEIAVAFRATALLEKFAENLAARNAGDARRLEERSGPKRTGKAGAA